MIKQIQLRGISRTPSDRATEDGGLAESLNVYLDNQECAPALIPDDVTSDLGLPTGTDGSDLFIHKTLKKDVIVARSGNDIKAFLNGKQILHHAISYDETINDISSVGNTLIIATSLRLYYYLFQNGNYIALGSNIPEIHCAFVNVDQYYETNNTFENPRLPRKGTDIKVTSSPGDFGYAKDDYEVLDPDGKAVLGRLWEGIQSLLGYNKKRGCLNSPIFLRYAVTLYDDTLWYLSSPILLGAGFNNTNGEEYSDPDFLHIPFGYDGENYTFHVSLRTAYKIGIHRYVENKEKVLLWKDLIKSIDIYSTTMINLYPNGDKAAVEKSSAQYGDYLGIDPASMTEEAMEKTITSYGTFFKIKSYSLEDFLNYTEGEYEELTEDLTDETISSKDLLQETSFFEELSSRKLLSYNNSVLLVGGERLISRGLPVLNGQHASRSASLNDDNHYSYKFKYYIKGIEKPYIVYSDGFIKANKGAYTNTGKYRVLCLPYSFISFPHSECYRVDIAPSYTDKFIYSLEMKPHPTIPNCSYAWFGLCKKISSLKSQDLGSIYMSDEFRQETLTNQLFVSEINNPFIFPLKGRHTFSAPLIGAAVATTALSQGQFGQFPLYVFTEDGIWAMETAANGSFITQKPLSREVCINPESITSVDNAVIFVTSKGVMMISGSQVTNLSPNMNGKHYALDEKAESIFDVSEWSDLTFAIKDPDPFMAFMKDARCAYDYEGSRLIFLSPSNPRFQYVYKLDTSTWHKLSLGIGLRKPLNSFPECLVYTILPAAKKVSVLINEHPYDLSEQEADEAVAGFMQNAPNAVMDPNLYNPKTLQNFVNGNIKEVILISDEGDLFLQALEYFVQHFNDYPPIIEEREELIQGLGPFKVYNLSTILDVANSQDSAKGCIITRPFDLGEPDVYKTIKTVKIRGDFDKGNVKYFLQGSDDGRIFYNLTSLRGKSWKMFRLFILANLEPTERISWVDIEYETRFKNRLR